MGVRLSMAGRKQVQVVAILIIFASSCLAQEDDWCKEFEDHFLTHCPAEVDDYTACCLCTQYYYYGCSCCKDIVDKFGVGGDITESCGPLRPEDLDPEDDKCYFENHTPDEENKYNPA